MKLEEVKQYKVGSKVFETREEAESYIKEQEIEKIRLNNFQVDFPLTPVIYYENVVSVDERGGLTVKARWFNLDDAIADMKNYADSYREKGTGFVYRVTVSLSDNPSRGTVSVRREKVFEK